MIHQFYKNKLIITCKKCSPSLEQFLMWRWLWCWWHSIWSYVWDAKIWVRMAYHPCVIQRATLLDAFERVIGIELKNVGYHPQLFWYFWHTWRFEFLAQLPSNYWLLLHKTVVYFLFTIIIPITIIRSI